MIVGICIGAQVMFCSAVVSVFVLKCVCQSVHRGSGHLSQCVTLCVFCSQEWA